MVAVDVGVMLQLTDGLLVVLPSLFVPNTVICTVLLVLPVSMLGVAGPTESEVRVGFWKKPRQLMPKAEIPSTPRAMVRRSFSFLDDIFLNASLARRLKPAKIVAEKNSA
jgi:hypothetical protein